MYSKAGLRPYTIHVVRALSSNAKRRGDGPTDVVAEWQILPTPKLGDLTTLQDIVSPDQVREAGAVLISEISLSYSEDVLCGRGEDGTPVPADESVFWEIRFLDIAGRETSRRRFVASSPPYANNASAEWSVNVTRSYGDRDRRGALR